MNLYGLAMLKQAKCRDEYNGAILDSKPSTVRVETVAQYSNHPNMRLAAGYGRWTHQ
jgi:hypothetical protein